MFRLFLALSALNGFLAVALGAFGAHGLRRRLAELADGAEQIVVLGAGFDTRAYRIDRPDVLVFEVDHPDTQADKRGALASAGVPLPANVRFVPVQGAPRIPVAYALHLWHATNVATG